MHKNNQTTYRPFTSQNVSFTSTAANATAVSATANIVRLAATEDCRISIDGTATSTSTLLFAGVPEYFSVHGRAVISVIRETTDGTLNITEMTQ